MGDRTSVALRILASQAEEAKEYFGGYGFDVDKSNKGFTDCCFDEVNYGNLDFLGDLAAAGIAYSSSWGNGDNYASGTEYCRFTAEGKCIVTQVYDDSQDPSLDSLLKLIDEPNALREFILLHQKKVSPLPWDNQEEYARIYKTRKLITG